MKAQSKTRPSTMLGKRSSVAMRLPTEFFVVAANRVGFEATPGDESAATASGGIRFWGQSFVSDPFGRVLSCASSEEPETSVVECDLTAIERVRQEWPFLRDRRVDAYADLSRRFRDSD